MARFILYARRALDTDPTTEEQFAPLRAWALAAGHEVVAEYADENIDTRAARDPVLCVATTGDTDDFPRELRDKGKGRRIAVRSSLRREHAAGVGVAQWRDSELRRQGRLPFQGGARDRHAAQDLTRQDAPIGRPPAEDEHPRDA